ncbi:MAG: carbohydrate-binding protein [Eubacterium sp.]|nr:carbohydrate-binding protein [Eubacterium sp.]
MRLDSPDGEVLCTVGGTDTGGWDKYQSFDYEIPKTSGVHSVYITYDTGWSDVNINWLNFS